MRRKAESTTRRVFFWKAGAVLSAPLAVATASAAEEPGARDADALEARLARRDDVDAIRDLYKRYAQHVNDGAHDAAARLYAEPATARVDATIRHLAADGFVEHDVIEIADDGRAASVRIHCVARMEMPIEPDCTLVEMARLQGEGVVTRIERRVLESTCVKRGGVWKIEQTTYGPASS